MITRCAAKSRSSPLKRYFSVRRSTPTAAMTSPPGSLPSAPEAAKSNCSIVNLPPYNTTPSAEASFSAASPSALCAWPGNRKTLMRPLLRAPMMPGAPSEAPVAVVPR